VTDLMFLMAGEATTVSPSLMRAQRRRQIDLVHLLWEAEEIDDRPRRLNGPPSCFRRRIHFRWRVARFRYFRRRTMRRCCSPDLNSMTSTGCIRNNSHHKAMRNPIRMAGRCSTGRKDRKSTRCT
jgi:hypothetical protein